MAGRADARHYGARRASAKVLVADARRRGTVVLAASRFNPVITQALVDGARKTLGQHGVPASRIRTVWVPGAFELPLAALSAAERAQTRAVIALGCLVRGQTPQYAAIGYAVAEGLTQVALKTKIPVTFGVIIAESMAQAKARAGHRGREAALAALAMMDIVRSS